MSSSARKLARKAARARKAKEPTELVIRPKASLAWRGLERVVAQHALPIERHEDVIAPSPCGHCGESRNEATHAEGIKPKPGDFSVCWGCANVNRFDSELRLVKVTDAELAAVSRDEVDHAVIEEMRALFRAAYTKPLNPKATRGEA